MAWPAVTARGWRGGGIAAGAAAPAVDEGVSEADILAMNPVWWLDADAQYVEDSTTGVGIVDAGAATDWLDKSGNDRDWTNPTIGYVPHWYESGAANSKPYVHFEGDRLQWTADDDIATPLTLYMVVSSDTIQANAQVFATAGGEYFRYRHNATYFPNALSGSLGTDGGPAFSGMQSTDPHIVQYFASGTVTDMRLDGGAFAGEDYYTGSTRQSENLIADTVLFYLGWGANYKFYEWLVIPGTHSNDDQDAVFSHLGAKYDIAVTAVS